MAATTGKDGGFNIGGSLVTFIDHWELDNSLATVETGGYGDTTIKRVGTIKDHRGSASGTLDRSDASQAALLDQFEDGSIADVDARFYTERGSDFWAMSAIVEGSRIVSELNGKVSVEFSFVHGSGDGLVWTEA